MEPFRRILIPLDFGEPSERALELAITMASRFDAQLTLLHVVSMPAYYYSAYAEGLAFPLEEMETRATAMLHATLATTKARYPRTDGQVVAGVPWETILASIESLKADLVIMGTHGRRGVARILLGSVAEKIVRHSPVPVLTTPAL